MAKAYRRVASRVIQVLFDHDQDTQACLVAV
ncbi:hypothetical protein F383_15371 [Gossypium arboreum]|uniref:Uncharacterized protein n=1 Tax=Gossypium arboreum TaxID=29729 RepID=A0A0B0NCG4_GOSAR|nr:hypothetical protein F383_15371 [Gossypium arboreum]